MTRPRTPVLAVIAAVAVAAGGLAGCGGSGGATTTTAGETDGLVTIQTDTVLRTTPTDSVGTSGTTPTGATSQALDDAIGEAEGAVTATLAVVRAQAANPDPVAAVQEITQLTERFDRAIDRVKAVVSNGEAERAIQDALVAEGAHLSDAYRAYIEAAVTAADSNSTSAFVAEGARFLAGLTGFGDTTG